MPPEAVTASPLTSTAASTLTSTSPLVSIVSTTSPPLSASNSRSRLDPEHPGGYGATDTFGPANRTDGRTLEECALIVHQFWARYPGLTDIVPPLPGFAIGLPANLPIGGADSADNTADPFLNQQDIEMSRGAILRPPLKPPPFAVDVSSEATVAARTALRSFIIEKNESAHHRPLHLSLYEAHWSFGHINYDSILSWERSGTLRADGISFQITIAYGVSAAKGLI